MTTVSWFTEAQAKAIIVAGSDYLAGLDSVTSYEISDWLNFHISETYHTGGNSGDEDITLDNEIASSMTKAAFKTYSVEQFKLILGAQSAKSSN